MSKYEPIYNEHSNNLILDIIMWLEKTDEYQIIIDTLDICHLIGKIQHQIKEIERLKEKIKGYEQERERVLNIIDERNNKAIEYIKNHIVATETENILLEILEGVDKE